MYTPLVTLLHCYTVLIVLGQRDREFREFRGQGDREFRELREFREFSGAPSLHSLISRHCEELQP